MISAKEAREMSILSLDKVLEHLHNKVYVAAALNANKIDHTNIDYNYVEQINSNKELKAELFAKLRNLGYTVSSYEYEYEDINNIYINIKKGFKIEW